MKKAFSLFLALALVLTLTPTASLAASDAYGSEIYLRDTVLQEGAVLSDNIYWSGSYDKPRHEYYVTYTPGANVFPAASYGETVCDRLTTGAAAQNYEALGYRVVAAINGDFYDTASGYPLGLLVSQGQLLSGSGNYYAVGFRADGSVVMGSPKLKITASWYDQSLTLAAINKPRVENGGATLLTYDFRNDHTTGAATPGVSLVATVLDGQATIGGAMTLLVEEVAEDEAARPIREDQVVLTAAATGSEQALTFLRSVRPGEIVTVSFATEDPAWSEVTEAIGALYSLVEDGVAQSGFEVSAAPRTAVGLKASGELILYTIDGRQSEHSMGASLGVMAQRMVELGCVTALCLDGGGSTTAVGSLPDSMASELLNSPSDHTQRKVSNHMLLLSDGTPTGRADHVYLSAAAPVVLSGQTLELTANLVDTNYFPMAGEVDLWASDGVIIGNTFIAPETSGWVTITAQSGGMAAAVDVLVVDTPDVMTVQWGENDVASITLVPGDKANLGVTASYNHLPLAANPSDFLWELDPSLGVIDENGVLTAAYTEGSGVISVTKGARTVQIPLTVNADSPFVDGQGHWASAYMAALYHRGILSGELHGDELYVFPDEAVTRAEFSLLLFRYLGLNAADYSEVEVPFADMDHVDAWAADAARAMYALGIINGAASGDQVIFDPHGILTRAQAVTMLGRLVATEAGQDADLSSFVDLDQVPDYALPHFQTMVALGIVGGTDTGALAPNSPLTRAAISKILATMP